MKTLNNTTHFPSAVSLNFNNTIKRNGFESGRKIGWINGGAKSTVGKVLLILAIKSMAPRVAVRALQGQWYRRGHRNVDGGITDIEIQISFKTVDGLN